MRGTLSYAFTGIFCLCFQLLEAQKPFSPDSATNRVLDLNPRYYKHKDTVWIISGICKPLKRQMLTGVDASHLKIPVPSEERSAFIKVHGNIQYDFVYRSLVDTPFSQKDFAQHTLRTSLDLLFDDRYPVKVILSSRRSNSHYFDDLTDINIQFNKGMYLQQVKAKVLHQLPQIPDQSALNEAESKYHQKKAEVERLQQWLDHPARFQEITEEKERLAVQRVLSTLPVPSASVPLSTEDINKKIEAKVFTEKDKFIAKLKDSLSKISDTAQNKVSEKLDTLSDRSVIARVKKAHSALDSSKRQLLQAEKQLNQAQKAIKDSINRLKQELAQARDPETLKAFLQSHRFDRRKLPKGWQTLGAINHVGIGRTWVDYSELTVKNVSLTGINTELNPSKFYLAFAAGKVNYRFRDFVMRERERNRQSLILLRGGWGKKEGNNFILTWYDGKRNLLSSFGTTPFRSQLESVIGMSAESRINLDPNNYVILEFAKSSYHTAGNTNQDKGKLFRKVWDFSNRDNEAYNIRVNSFWPSTQTRVTGYYRKMGQQFQSFNLQPINVNQEAYQIRVRQSLWKQQLHLDAGLRKNDFNSPYLNPGVSSKTIFKSLQATLRIPKYPMLTLGYYPSTQLTVLNNNMIVENQYNTLSALMSYSYRLGQLNMNSNASYLKFYNKGADTGFIYFNASNWTATHYLFLNKVQWQTGLTLSSQRNVNIVSLEQALTWQPRNWFQLSGSLKHNRLNRTSSLWGNSLGFALIIPKFGTIRGTYDKSYLPGTSRDLLPVEMGQLSYYRSF